MVFRHHRLRGTWRSVIHKSLPEVSHVTLSLGDAHTSLKFGATRPKSTAKLACTRPLSASGFFLPAFISQPSPFTILHCLARIQHCPLPRRDTLVHSTTREYHYQTSFWLYFYASFRLHRFAGSDKGFRTSTRQQCRSF
jgi:hypothetical protein